MMVWIEVKSGEYILKVWWCSMTSWSNGWWIMDYFHLFPVCEVFFLILFGSTSTPWPPYRKIALCCKNNDLERYVSIRRIACLYHGVFHGLFTYVQIVYRRVNKKSIKVMLPTSLMAIHHTEKTMIPQFPIKYVYI